MIHRSLSNCWGVKFLSDHLSLTHSSHLLIHRSGIWVQFGRGRRRRRASSARPVQTHREVPLWCQRSESALPGAASAQAHDHTCGRRHPALIHRWAVWDTGRADPHVHGKQRHTTEAGHHHSRSESHADLRGLGGPAAWHGWMASAEDPVREREGLVSPTGIPADQTEALLIRHTYCTWVLLKLWH